MTMVQMVNVRAGVNESGTATRSSVANSAPAPPMRAAPNTNAWSFRKYVFLPSARAASSSSRTAFRVRPQGARVARSMRTNTISTMSPTVSAYASSVLQMSWPNSNGLGTPRIPYTPPVTESQFRMDSTAIAERAKVAIAR